MNNENNYLTKLWHSTAHVFAEAITTLYPNAKMAIGPPIEKGFYYDFEIIEKIKESDLERIEKKMLEVIKTSSEIKQEILSIKKAKELFAKNSYKLELINDLEESGENTISIYKSNNFFDLCKGPHVKNFEEIKAFKLLKISSAYWKGNEKNKQLTRVYGISFSSEKELELFLEEKTKLENNDHNKIGREQNLFMTHELIGQGLPLLMPRGTKIFQILSRFVEDEEEKRGYLYTRTPYMAKIDLYKASGHWDHYKDGMFIIGDETKGEVLALRPMTCPYQFLIYNNGLKSYKDLPIKYGETSVLFRNESSGEMHGLTRIRQFTLSEGHIIVTPEQLEEEFTKAVELLKYVMKTLGIEKDISYRFSKWDPENKKGKYIDNPTAWEQTQKEMKIILDKLKLNYVEAEGEAAFYGPKLDLQTTNVFGKEDTLLTIQIDFALSERLDMTYIDKDGKKKRPYIIHRSSVGCYERTIAMLIEKHGGALPVWLSPEQIIIIPVSDKFLEEAKKINELFLENGIRSKLDDRNESLGYRIRDAQKMKAPYIGVIGAKEIETKTISIRNRKNEQTVLLVEECVQKILKENNDKIIE